MAKEQFNFRLERSILERIREQARVQKVTVTEWMENACLKELGVLDDPEGMAESWRGIDRLKKLEYDVKAIKESLETVTSRLDSRVDGVWDSIDYISAQLDAVKQQSEENSENKKANRENEIALRRLSELTSELKAQGSDNPFREAIKQVQKEMDDF